MTRPSSSGPDESPRGRYRSGLRPLAWVLLLVVVGVTFASLGWEGRRAWCQCGRPYPWSGGINSEHTSQHLLDPYSFSHLLHGVLFYGLFRLVAGRFRWDARLVLAIALECTWEVIENSGTVIERYRRATIALGYEGDSLVNSLGDILSCGLGFWLAWRLPVRWSIALYVLVEVALLVAYRDNLLLNVIMLIHPFEVVKAWQSGG